MGGGAPNTTIRRVSDASVVLTLDPKYGVIAFSGDNSRVLVNTSPWASGAKTHLAVIEVSTGKVLWSYNGDQELGGWYRDPAGSAFAVMLKATYDQAAHIPVSVTVVFADGRSTALPNG